jgi:hypothetical protein
VEEQFGRKMKERQAFERQYLKLDKLSNEHLQYLKEQAKANRIEKKKMVSECSQVSTASQGFIGMLPYNYDRKTALDSPTELTFEFLQKRSQCI